MNCLFINDNIIAYLEQELSKPDRTLFDNHLAKCETCQHLVAEVQLTYKLVEKPKDFSVSESFVEETINKMHKQEARIIPMIFQALKPIAVAASIGLGILIGNGELSVLNSASYSDEESLVVDITETSEYSVWQSFEEDYGNED
jgi:anti-sigma factor RsiW